ncbi:SLAP domain-containing protein [Siminovitchia fortis]|uniref:SLAP domain-containing protein n=1 Tax=Siminovitchia fortis TaxID=254758 RepID=UPI0011A339E9|nr:SLAP domain-containing protein [Siminovitchia fortis]
MVKLHFHPVWDSKLTKEQKDELVKILKSRSKPSGDLEAALVRGKYKKNGGLVATVLLLNGREKRLEIGRIKVQITDDKGVVVAEETFDPSLHLEPDTAQPWSFVFSKESVRIPNANPMIWKINLLINGQI